MPALQKLDVIKSSFLRDMRLNQVPDVNPFRVHGRSNAPIGTMVIGILFACASRRAIAKEN